MSFCPLEQLRFNLDIELRPCHQTAQDTSVYAGGGAICKDCIIHISGFG
jgi:hypothetical protein